MDAVRSFMTARMSKDVPKSTNSTPKVQKPKASIKKNDSFNSNPSTVGTPSTVASTPKEASVPKDASFRKTKEALKQRADGQGDILAPFLYNFAEYDELEVARKKLKHCTTFCSMLGLHTTEQCRSAVQAALALSMCGFDAEEMEGVLAYALVNLNKKFQYVSGLDGDERSDLAAYHIVLAQSIMHDDFCPLSVFCDACFTKKLTWHQFYGKLIIVMKKWDNRIVVKAKDLDASLDLFQAGAA
jgi:hypothetical protein